MRLSEAAGNAGALSIIILNSRMTPLLLSARMLAAAPALRGSASDALPPQSKRFNGDVDVSQEVFDAARAAVLTTLTPERMRETYRTAFAPARKRYTAVVMLPKRTLLHRALAAQTAASAAWADASPTARSSAVLVAGAAGALAVAVVYARWRAWRRA